MGACTSKSNSRKLEQKSSQESFRMENPTPKAFQFIDSNRSEQQTKFAREGQSERFRGKSKGRKYYQALYKAQKSARSRPQSQGDSPFPSPQNDRLKKQTPFQSDDVMNRIQFNDMKQDDIQGNNRQMRQKQNIVKDSIMEQHSNFEKSPIQDNRGKKLVTYQGQEKEKEQIKEQATGYSPEKPVVLQRTNNLQAKKKDEKLAENITIIPKQMNETLFKLFTSTLQGTSVFKNSTKDEILGLLGKMFYCEFKENQYVFKQGDEGTCYFIVEFGQASILINNEEKKIVGRGDGFGELALLFDQPRAASVKITEKCGFWALSRKIFQDHIKQQMEKDYEENMQLLNKVKFFDVMTSEQKAQICHASVTMSYQQGQKIVTEGEDAKHFFIIKKGRVSILKGTQEIKKIGEGDSFGEAALLVNSVRQASCLADDQLVKCFVLGRDEIMHALGDKVDQVIQNNKIRMAIQRSDILGQLNSIQIERVLGEVEIKKVSKSTQMINKGQVCENLIIILEGELKPEKIKNGQVKQGGLFGDKYLKKEFKDSLMKDNYFADTDLVIANISFSKFYEAIGGSDLEAIIIKNQNSYEKRFLNVSNKQSEKLEKEYQSLDVSQMIKMVVLDQDIPKFCQAIVKQASIKKFYNACVYHKYWVIEQQLEAFYKEYKTLIQSIQFPFMTQFIRTMKDEQCIYFIEEFVNGQFMVDALMEIGTLNNYDCQFFVGSMIVTLEYLHARNIIYRNVRPESIMVASNGYLKFTNHSDMKSAPTGRAITMLMFNPYSAPETLDRKGYSFSIDLWSVGVCMYEFLIGKVPWPQQKDPLRMQQDILKNPNLTFPSYFNNDKAKSLIIQLLDLNPAKRLGGSYAALKAHKFFHNFDWDDLLDYKLKPPFHPSDLILKKNIANQKLNPRDAISNSLLVKGGITYNLNNDRIIGWDDIYV